VPSKGKLGKKKPQGGGPVGGKKKLTRGKAAFPNLLRRVKKRVRGFSRGADPLKGPGVYKGRPFFQGLKIDEHSLMKYTRQKGKGSL